MERLVQRETERERESVGGNEASVSESAALTRSIGTSQHSVYVTIESAFGTGYLAVCERVNATALRESISSCNVVDRDRTDAPSPDCFGIQYL